MVGALLLILVYGPHERAHRQNEAELEGWIKKSYKGEGEKK
jgi:hypothetical protein